MGWLCEGTITIRLLDVQAVHAHQALTRGLQLAVISTCPGQNVTVEALDV